MPNTIKITKLKYILQPGCNTKMSIYDPETHNMARDILVHHGIMPESTTIQFGGAGMPWSSPTSEEGLYEMWMPILYESNNTYNVIMLRHYEGNLAEIITDINKQNNYKYVCSNCGVPEGSLMRKEPLNGPCVYENINMAKTILSTTPEAVLFSSSDARLFEDPHGLVCMLANQSGRHHFDLVDGCLYVRSCPHI